MCVPGLGSATVSRLWRWVLIGAVAALVLGTVGNGEWQRVRTAPDDFQSGFALLKLVFFGLVPVFVFALAFVIVRAEMRGRRR